MVLTFCNFNSVSLLVLLGIKRHEYILLRTDPSLVHKIDKRYITNFNKVFSFTHCVKLHIAMEVQYFCWMSVVTRLLEHCNPWPHVANHHISNKRAIIIMMSFAAPVLIMTSFSLWRHLLLSWPCPALWTYVRTPYRI